MAGWLAGIVVKGYGYGLVGNIAVGILGSVIGGWLFGTYFVGSVGGLPGAIIGGATVGAIILLFCPSGHSASNLIAIELAATFLTKGRPKALCGNFSARRQLVR